MCQGETAHQRTDLSGAVPPRAGALQSPPLLQMSLASCRLVLFLLRPCFAAIQVYQYEDRKGTLLKSMSCSLSICLATSFVQRRV